MALFTEQSLINRVNKKFPSILNENILFSKAQNILEKSISDSFELGGVVSKYDIFLSHSSDDAIKVYGLKLKLEDLGYNVFVDWIESPNTDRSEVTKNNAEFLRRTMNNCSALIYAFSLNSIESRWMPWELGYFDGINGKIAILPIVKKEKYSFKEVEYLGLYYYADIAQTKTKNIEKLWVNASENEYTLFDSWLDGEKLTYHS